MMKIAILLALLAATIHTTTACMCNEYDPKRSACSEELVVRAKLNNRTGFFHDDRHNDLPYHTNFQFETLETFKGSIESTFEVNDYEASTSCALLFRAEVGDVFVLTGRKLDKGFLTMNYCNYAQKWDTLTEKERQGFRGQYYQQC